MRLPATLLLAALVLAGCSTPGEPLPPEWQGRDLREGSWLNVTLQPQQTLSLEYPPWSSGTKVSWDWFTTPDQYQTFQLVRSEAGRQTKLFIRDRTNETGSLVIPQSGAHQLAWINDFFLPVTLTIQAPDGFQQRVYPPGEGPGCLLLAPQPC